MGFDTAGFVGCILINPPLGAEYEDVDFDIEKETWNIYELIDGSTIKVRTILFKLVRRKKLATGEAPYAGGFQNAFSVRAPERLKGAPSTKVYSPEELDKLPKSEVGFSPVLEDWNIYHLKDGTRIKVKLVVSLVQRVKAVFDQFGDPMYILNSSNVISPTPKQ